MDWNQLKEEIYYVDGSLLDIYVLNTTAEDWWRWVELVNANYSVTFSGLDSGQTQDWIDFAVVERMWAKPEEREWSTARIQLRNFTINCLFFWEGDIENDIDPKDFQSIEDHEALLLYLQRVSEALQKPVRLTPENTEEMALIEVNGSDVRITPPQ
ncbi:hypothetical protein [Hymenobacter jeollabukensis]|uniref:Uncharacterized protein n=1 Tax=Hymenobacter jeollabukensis TaxID=2025313 RepID=A0A5R8WQ55_9BACT|nr:hypothetical protein [Hymenobacter jeollabukensis]TLM91831.1 hypothetical protein FDY95_14835 [Hymenobacter jeollabukensis]